MAKLPTQARLRKLLAYDPETGVLTWKPRKSGHRPAWWNKLYAGKPAGTITPGGPVALKIGNRNFLAHRVIWAMVHGTWPECVVHRNGKLADNRLANLRDASRKGGQRSLRMLSTNTSGVRGVSWSKTRGKWVAQIKIDDWTFCLGAFDEKGAAAQARRAAEVKRDRLTD